MNSRKSAYIAAKPNASDHPITNHQTPDFPSSNLPHLYNAVGSVS